MAIACAYCDGEHSSPQGVRRCWEDTGRREVPTADGESVPVAPEPELLVADDAPAVPSRSSRTDMPARTGPARRSERRATVPGPIDPAAARQPAGAGPDALGRCAVVAPGAVVPAPWHEAERLAITASTLDAPQDALATLRDAHHGRRRLVIELGVDFATVPGQRSSSAPYELGPRFAFDLDELHHLVWSNSVDLRREDAPRWSAVDRAVENGASPTEDGRGDVRLGDGTPVWLDGGPLRHVPPIDGIAVVHVIGAEHGRLVPPGENETSADLAPDQLAAVTHPAGAARIIAPAGSGKTRVLTERARQLLTRWNLPPTALSLVAFNKRAQEEMTERTRDLPGLHVRTLNSIALAIVNGTPPFAPQSSRWRTIDEPEVRRILGDLVKFPRRRNSDPVAPWIEALSLIRLGLVEPSEAEQRYDGDVDGLADVWPAYRSRLERAGAVDFDDQIYRALLVLLRDPDARHAAQRACRVMLVDEFQDLTPAHLLLIRLLAAPGGAVFGVGDDDQTIYGYNGADPAWLIEFAELFPGAGAHPLEVNYRCPAGLVDAADRLLRHNRRRVAKTIRAAATAEPGGWTVDAAVDPVAATVGAVQGHVAGGARPGDVAVLTRVNALLAPVQVALSAAGVPIAGGVGLEFADRTAVRTVLAWLRLARSGHDGAGRFAPDDVREALRRPSRSFHPRINDWVCEQGDVVDLHRLAGRLNNERDAERVAEFATDVQTLQKLVQGGAPTSDIVLTLVDEIGLAGSVATLDTSRRGMNRSAQGDDLTAILHLAALHDDAATFERWLRGHLAVKRSADGVVLATVHRVKGQEWPFVVVHLADADQYPHRLADDVEEERRLFHVAMTRAQRSVTIVTGPRPSPFVAELTTEPTESRVVSSHRPTREARTTGGSKTTGDATEGLDPAAQQRFAALRDLRNELRDGKPAYVVFDNKTLAAIAKSAPTSTAELRRIPGIGPAKLDKYGDAVLDLIRTSLA